MVKILDFGLAFISNLSADVLLQRSTTSRFLKGEDSCNDSSSVRGHSCVISGGDLRLSGKSGAACWELLCFVLPGRHFELDFRFGRIVSIIGVNYSLNFGSCFVDQCFHPPVVVSVLSLLICTCTTCRFYCLSCASCTYLL